MSPDNKARIALALIFVASIAASAALAEQKTLPVDVETNAGGVPVACTGIGQTRLDPKWQAYGVRVEVSNAANEYLVGGAVTVKDRKGAEVLSVSCDAPWILMKLPAGAYSIEGRLLNSAAKPKSAPFSPPKSGQMRLVLQFPDA
jgi:hypothetical protein